MNSFRLFIVGLILAASILVGLPSQQAEATFLCNNAWMSTATTGTGTITLGTAQTGYQTFAECGITNGQDVRYRIFDGSAWEVGHGTYTSSGTTLSRTVLESSNSDSAINLSGTATVIITPLTQDMVSESTPTDTSVPITDYAIIMEGGVVERALVDDFLESINGLTEDTAPNQADDFLAFYDNSEGVVNKVNPEKMGVGKQPVPLLAAAGVIPSGGAIAGCTPISMFDSGSNDIMFRQCSFSAGTDNAIEWLVPVPKGVDESVDLTARVDWTSATTTDSTDDVIWTMACVAFSNDDAINGNAFPTVDTVTDTQTAAGDFLSSSEITAITPAGTWAENDMLVCRLTRDADNASDNFNGTAELINVMLYFTTSTNTDN